MLIPPWSGASRWVRGRFVLGAWAARQWIAPPVDPIAERLQRATAGGSSPSPGSRPLYTRDSSLHSVGARVLAALAKVARPSAADELQRVRAQLEHAGLRGPHTLEVYYGARLALALALAGAFLLVDAALVNPLPHSSAAVVGWRRWGSLLPASGCDRAWRRGNGRSLAGCPTRSTCWSPASSRAWAWRRRWPAWWRRLAWGAPLLADELQLAMLEIRAGVARGEAFRRLAARTGLEELRNLAATLIQTELFGTSVARALRVQSAGMRVRRTQRAEEKAATVATRMLLPLILCVLPSLFAVIMGPAAVRIIRMLLPSLAGEQ